MNNNLLVVAVSIILVIIVGGIVFRRVQSAGAVKQAKEYAAKRGWKYVASESGLLATYPQLYPFYSSGVSTVKAGLSFGSSSTQDCRDVLYFRSGEYAGQSFTYTYTSTDRDSDSSSKEQRYFWHVVGLELPVPFPSLIVRRRRKIELPQARLSKPVELPNADLNSMYTVHSEHHQAAFDLMTAEMARWLVEGQFQNELVLQDNRLYVFCKGRQKVENIEPMLAQLNGFIAHISSEAWHKAQGEYPRPERVKMFEALNVNAMKDAYKEWRDKK